MAGAHRIILDTNVFVGAGFNRRSASAQLIETARAGDLDLIWDVATRDETRRVMTKIPRISWDSVADVFLPEHEWRTGTDLVAVGFVEDPEDRKFAALSQATGATLISSDSDLLDHADRLDVVPPGRFLDALRSTNASPDIIPDPAD